MEYLPAGKMGATNLPLLAHCVGSERMRLCASPPVLVHCSSLTAAYAPLFAITSPQVFEQAAADTNTPICSSLGGTSVSPPRTTTSPIAPIVATSPGMLSTIWRQDSSVEPSASAPHLRCQIFTGVAFI